MKQAILVVDPLSSAEYLVKRLQQLGYEVVALKTIHAKDDYCEYATLPFFAVIDSSQDPAQDAETIKALKEIRFIAGLYGSESSVAYTDKLFSLLFPAQANSLATSQLRYDKYYMNAALAEHGMPAIRQMKLNNSLSYQAKCAEALEFFQENNNQMVIKPAFGSAASVGVFSPIDRQDIERYFAQQNNFLFVDGDYLLQEKLAGEEYYVDACSYQGQHIITGIGKYSKNQASNQFEYDYIDDLDQTADDLVPLKKSIYEYLTILGMNNGLSHSEVMKTPNGFRLIELNPRISGGHGFINRMIKSRYGADQLDVFSQQISGKPTQSVHNKFYQRTFMFKNRKGIYNSIDLAPIQNLSSFVDCEILRPNETIARTTDKSMLALVMLIWLQSDSIVQIEQDTDCLFQLEAAGACLLC